MVLATVLCRGTVHEVDVDGVAVDPIDVDLENLRLDRWQLDNLLLTFLPLL